MKKLILAFLAITAVLVFIFLPTKDIVQPELKSKFNKAAKVGMGIGTATDRFARFNYERNKLVDPATGEIPQYMRQRELMFAQTINQNAKKMDSDVVEFESRGPYNVGGRTRAFAIDVTDENVFLAGSVSGGVWKSIDAGANWYKVSSSNENVAVTTIVQDTRPGHTSDWYFGTGELFGASQSGTGAFFLGNGVYKSSDSGESWESLPMTASETPQTFDDIWDGIWRIAIDASNMDQTEIYVATYSTIYRTINGGTTWTPVLTSSLAGDISYFTEVVVSTEGVVYAGMSSENDIISFGLSPIGGIWRSETGNSNDFEDITSPDFPPTFGRIVLGLNPSNEDEVYVLASNVDPAFGKEGDTPIQEPQYSALWKYEYLDGDGTGSGGEWTELTENLFAGPNDFDDFYPQNGYNLMVAVHPDDENVVFVGATNLFRSTDGFTSADNVTHIGGYAIGTAMPLVRSYPNHHSDQHGVFFHPSEPNSMLSFNDGGLSKTTDVLADNVEWETLNNGYISTQFYAIAIDPTDTNNLVMGGLQDNGTFVTDTKSDTVPWKKPYGADGGFCSIMENGEHFIVSTQSGRLLKTKLGETRELNEYERFDPALPRDEFEFINPWTLDPQTRDALFMPIGNKLWVRENLSDITFTNSWDSTSVGWTILPDSLVTGQFRSIEASKIPYGLVYLGTDSINIFKVIDIYSSNPQFLDITDNGMPDGNVEDIAVDPRNGNRVLIGYSNYNIYSLFYSEDAGNNWMRVAGNLEQFPNGTGNGPSIRAVNILPINDEEAHYFVGTSTGLYHTNNLYNDSTVWTLLSDDLIGNSIVSDIKSRATDGYVAVGTHGYGMFSANTPEDPPPPIVDVEESYEVSNLTAYPNPSNNFINIKFNTTNGRPFEIQFFDVLGRKIVLETIADKSFGDEVKKQFDVSQLAKGIYYYAVETSGFKQTKNFVVQ